MIIQRIWRGWAAPWFRAPHLSTFFESLGAVLDVQAQRVLDGRLAAIPYAGSGTSVALTATGQRIECQPDALPYHAIDRALPIYATMPLIGQRFNVSRWRQRHARRGTHRGELEYVQPWFLSGTLPKIHIVHHNSRADISTWHTIDAASVYTQTVVTPGNFNFDNDGRDSKVPIAPAWAGSTGYVVNNLVTNDGQSLYRCIAPGTSASSGGPTGIGTNITDGTAHWQYRIAWSRWHVFIETTGTALQSDLTHYDDGSLYDGGQVYNGITPAGSATDLVSMFVDWKAAHSACWTIALSTMPILPNSLATVNADGSTSHPVGNWGKLIDPTTHKPTRPSTLTFIRDRSQY